MISVCAVVFLTLSRMVNISTILNKEWASSLRHYHFLRYETWYFVHSLLDSVYIRCGTMGTTSRGQNGSEPLERAQLHSAINDDAMARKG